MFILAKMAMQSPPNGCSPTAKPFLRFREVFERYQDSPGAPQESCALSPLVSLDAAIPQTLIGDKVYPFFLFLPLLWSTNHLQQ